jgi:hypothetical protein
MQLLKVKSPADYVANSKVAQFVSTNPNIGNYLPVLAIQQMLHENTDVFNIHREIDYDFVNANYEVAVIGGAGLLHKVFEPFWREFAQKCTLPYVIWGVGLCSLDSAVEPTYVSPDAASAVFERALAVNVRDALTATTYGSSIVDQISVTECPTVFYLRRFKVVPEKDAVTLVAHPDLINDAVHKAAVKSLVERGLKVRKTLNVQTEAEGIDDIIYDYYCQSSLIVTSRLHGAIIAYGLGLPYIALVGDEKLREFHRTYGGGWLANDVAELNEVLDRADFVFAAPGVEPAKPDLTGVTNFGNVASALLDKAQNK